MSAHAFDQPATIERHSEALLRAAEGHLDAPVEHCPGWTTADLVAHLTEVHWFWASVVEGLLPAPPEGERPPRAPDAQLLDAAREQAARLVAVLRAADPAAPCWTWSPGRQYAGFVVRHQVQEAAVHHWDAAHATGADWWMEPPAAADAVDEFLAVSVSSEQDPADPPRPALEGAFVLRARDTGDAWTVTDASVPGTVSVTAGAAAGVPVLEADAADLLLWLYGRVPLDTPPDLDDLVRRFRALCFTD